MKSRAPIPLSREENTEEDSKTGRDNIKNPFYDGKNGGDEVLKEERALREGNMASKSLLLVHFFGCKQ